jgi:hypothetical protein
MIVYDLTCAVGHRFESWFRNAAAFDEQCEGAAVACPYCGNREIGKAPMAPRVSRGISGPASSESTAGEKPSEVGGAEPAAGPAGPPAALLEMLRQLRRHVESNCDYVGPAFPEHARRIFYGETTPRGIYGEASAEEAEALKDEGIETQQIPWLPRRNG